MRIAISNFGRSGFPANAQAGHICAGRIARFDRDHHHFLDVSSSLRAHWPLPYFGIDDAPNLTILVQVAADHVRLHHRSTVGYGLSDEHHMDGGRLELTLSKGGVGKGGFLLEKLCA